MVVPSFVAAAAVVAKTDFVATLPAGFVEAIKRQFKLVVLKVRAPAVRTTLKLIWHERTHNDPASRAFRSMVERSVVGL